MFYLLAQAVEPVINGLDVVNKVDAFYQNAWVKLIIMVAILGSLIGVVIPLIIQRIQLSSFDKTEKRFKDEIEQIKSETQVSIQKEVGVLKSKFDEIQKNMEKKIDEKTRSNRSEFYEQMAINLDYDGNNPVCSFMFYIFAARDCAILKEYESLTRLFNQAISIPEENMKILTKTSTAETKESLKETQKSILDDIDEICKILKEQNAISKYSEQLAKVREICENLTTVA